MSGQHVFFLSRALFLSRKSVPLLGNYVPMTNHSSKYGNVPDMEYFCNVILIEKAHPTTTHMHYS